LNLACIESEIFYAFRGARMNRKNDGHFLRNFFQGVQYAAKDFAVVHVRRTVQCHQCVISILLSKRQCLFPVFQQGVDHHVSDEEDLRRIDAFAL